MVVTRWSPGKHPINEKEEKMLTRLSDRVEVNAEGKSRKIHRYGLWGTSSEIESRGKKWVVVHPNKKEKEFHYREEAEHYLEDLVAGRVRS